MTPRPKNENLHQSIRAFVISASRTLSSFLEAGEKVPHVKRGRLELRSDGSWSYGPVSRPEYHRFFGIHRKEIERLPEYAACRRVMGSDAVVSKQVDCLVGTYSEQVRRTSWDYLSRFLELQLCQSPGKLEFNSELFEKMYGELERFLYDDTIEVRVSAPLHGFLGDFAEMDLGKGLRIRTIMLTELEELLDEGKWVSFVPQFEIPGFKYVMELIYRTKKEVGEISRDAALTSEVDAIKEFNKLLSALRLFKKGAVGFSIVKTMLVFDAPTMGKTSLGGLGHKRFWAKLYVLSANQIPQFRSFWERFVHVDTDKASPLSVAIRRFNYAQERERQEDRLVDHMVAFEALFFREGETGEFRHKLAVRTARLLRSSLAERNKLAKEMGRFYDLRSAIVHGENVELNDEFIDSVDSHLRESINIFLNELRTCTHNDFIDRLDLG